jgi:PAS domain S-box-containing protein
MTGDPDGEIAALRSELDATNRGLIALHAELDAARQREAQLAAIVQSSDDAMYSMTPDRTVVTWNAGAERLLGYSHDEIVGRNIDVLIPPELAGDLDIPAKRLEAGDAPDSFDTRRRRKNGTLVDVSATLSAMRDPGGEVIGFCMVLRDITDRLQVEEDLAVARAEQEVFREQERIARDLHDHVIQRLFAAGMSLQAAAGITEGADVRTRLESVVDDLDDTIAVIRTAIFALQQADRDEATGLREQILDVAKHAADVLGFHPTVRFDGPVDATVSDDVAAHAVAVLREALSNVARHAAATRTDVTATATAGDEFVLEVRDNGHGIGDTTRRSGLRNLRERAEMLGGTLTVDSSSDGGGTHLAWRVPLLPAS